MKHHRRYIVFVIITVGFAFALVSCGNLYVDPFDAGGWFASPRFASARLQESSRTLKANQLRRAEIEFVILGSSRMELGIDPNGLGIQTLGSGYNAGLPGSNLYEARRVLEFALNQCNVEAVFLGVELVMLSEYRDAVADFATSGFAEPSFASSVERRFQTMLGASTLTASWNLLQLSDDTRPPRLQDGFRASPEYVGNPRVLSEELASYYLSSPEAYFEYQFDEAKLADLNWIASTCRDHQIDLYLFVPPIHVKQLELIDYVGLWNDFERLKRELCRIAAENDSPETVVAAWDFSGSEGVVSEPFPDGSAASAQMEFFYEMSHFRPSVGAEAIRQMVTGAQASSIDLRGVRLTPEILDAHLRAQRQIVVRNSRD